MDTLFGNLTVGDEFISQAGYQYTKVASERYGSYGRCNAIGTEIYFSGNTPVTRVANEEAK